MRRIFFAAALLLVLSCRQESLGPLNGILVVYSPILSDYIDQGGLDEIKLVVETVDPEQVFSFAFAETQEFTGTLKERRVILFLLSEQDAEWMPGELQELNPGILSGNDLWALNQQVFGVFVDPSGEESLPEDLPALLLDAYNNQLRAYLYKSFVSTSMTSEARMDSLGEIGISMDIPKSYNTHRWLPLEGFAQYQRQPDDECLLILSINILRPDAEFTMENAILAREAMARTYFFDAEADSVDRARTTGTPFSSGGFQGWEITGVWRNPEFLNAGAFTSRVLDTGEEWYILDMEVYNPGYAKEPYLREGWIIMDTFRKE